MRNRRNIVNEFKDIQLALNMQAPVTAMEHVGRFLMAIQIAYTKDEISSIELSLLISIYGKIRTKVMVEIINEYK